MYSEREAAQGGAWKSRDASGSGGKWVAEKLSVGFEFRHLGWVVVMVVIAAAGREGGACCQRPRR